MAVFRFFALALIAAALMLLGADVIATLESESLTIVRSLDHILSLVGVDGTRAAQGLPLQLVRTWARILTWPAWSVIGIPGIVIGLLTSATPRPPAPPPAPPPIRF